MVVSPPSVNSEAALQMQVQIKQEFSPVERFQQKIDRASMKQDQPFSSPQHDVSSSPFDDNKSNAGNSQMFQMNSSPPSFDKLGVSISGGGSFGVSSSSMGSGGFSPSSSQVLSPQYSRQRIMTGDEVQCNMCGRTLCNKYVLKVHMRDMHSPRQNHQCPLCRRCYSSLNSLRVHMSTSHKTLGQPPQPPQPPQ